MKEFTFGVLAFNHESYIIEHLESIKYLIERHGSDIFVDLVINDDCSRDKTIILIDKWLGLNSHFFRNINKIFNNKNIGTCQSFLNIVRNTKTDALKITAGDDVYSCENLFEYGVLPEDVSILSGIPLNIIDGEIIKNNRELLGVYLSREIYKDKNYLDRFKGLSNNNAPNIFYNKSNLTSLKFESFISKCDVIEDWSTQIFIAENYPETKFSLVEKVFVYYRRTEGSTYIVANNRFVKDKLFIYQYLIDGSLSVFEKILLKNRRFLFVSGNGVFNKIFNIAFYQFFIRSIPYIFREKKKIEKINTSRFVSHYEIIKSNASSFYSKK